MRRVRPKTAREAPARVPSKLRDQRSDQQRVVRHTPIQKIERVRGSREGEGEIQIASHIPIRIKNITSSR